MLTDRDLRELLEFQSEHPVLSVYLNTDVSQRTVDEMRLQLRAMLRESQAPAADRAAVEEHFEHDVSWEGNGAAVFSCAAEGMFRAFSLAVPLPNRVHVARRPFVKPLANALDNYGGYGVAVVDQQRARLFFFHLGELLAEEEFVGEEVRRTKRGGGSQATGRRGGVAGLTRYTDEIAERNLREAAAQAGRFFEKHRVRRVLIGGTDGNVALFRTMLSKAWQSLVVGTFPISMNAGHVEVMKKALEIGRQAERQREQALVHTVITAAAKGKNGVVRLADTLEAVREGRVQTLLISEGFHAPGYRCTGCDYLVVEALDVCPFCGKPFVPISDAVDLAVNQVLAQGGEVEVVNVPALEEAGHIGALLRY